MFLLIGAFIAGVITVLAPCVLPLLPVIIGGSISGNIQDKRRPLIITASLAVSLILFTLLLKVTTLFINIPPAAIVFASGGIIVGIGIVMLVPSLYEKLISSMNLQAKSQQLLGRSAGKGAVVGAIITGGALGPVFSSCSPVYGYILATVLPVNFGIAMIYMVAYIAGLSAMLLLVGFIGQRFVRRIKFASNPRGWFQRVIAVLFIIVGLLVMTGYDKRLQTYVSAHTPFNFDGLSAKLIPDGAHASQAGVLNVTPYKAPEFTGLTNWINSPPQTIASMKGKVILVDFWTYSCINCIRTQPYLRDWYKNYGGDKFEIVGVHAPEFSFERNPSNVAEASKKAGLIYPIALDNDFATWGAYGNQYWPSNYLIDQEGNVRRVHYGEGQYGETEQAIRQLLAEHGGSVPKTTTAALSGSVPVSAQETPETYLGTKQASNFIGVPRLAQGVHDFTPADLAKVNNWTLGGRWEVTSEGIKAIQDSVLRFRIAAKEAYVVTGSEQAGNIEITLNGQPISVTKAAGADVTDSIVAVSKAQLYRIVQFNKLELDNTLELHVPSGVQLNVFTFGS